MSDLCRLIWCALIGLFRPQAAGSRNPCASASAQRPAAQIPEAIDLQQRRPSVACWTLPSGARGPGRSEDYEAGDVAALAPGRLPNLLALEVPAARGSTDHTSGHSPPHPRDECRKSALWRTPDTRRTADLFLVPTISFRLLYGFLILRHARRELLWLGVTAHPTAEWIAHQLTEVYGWRQAPQYIIRDRDRAYGHVRAMGIRDRPIAPRSPWQNGCAERLIGSIRRDCLDHVLVFGERHLRHLLKSYQEYYNQTRTHLSLQKDAPVSRAVQAAGRTFAVPILGGRHHQYIRA
jgi:transposase InsO family protein